MLPPKSHHCDTEYRRSFKKSRFNCSATTYQRNLDFRTEQKRRFVEHNPEPFAWDPEDIDSDPGSDWSCEDLGRTNRLTHTQYKHEKLNRLYDKRMNGKDLGKSRGGEVQTASNRLRHDDSRQQSEGEKDETDEEEDGVSGSDSEDSVVHVIEPEFVKEPAKRTDSVETVNETMEEISAPRPVANKQTQTDRDGKHRQEKKSSLAPFLPYGYEANVKETGKKQTHNVRAAGEVYPSALRAQKNRRTTDQQIHNRGKHGQPNRLRPTTSQPVGIFIHSDDFEEPDWVTEYDRNFQLYDQNEYKKRPDSARVHANELVPQLSGKARRKTHS